MQLEPTLQTEFFDGRRKRLVESGVILHIEALVRQLVKQHCDKSKVAPVHHRVQNRIAELAERRIGNHSPHGDIEPAFAQSFRCPDRVLL